MFYNEANTLTGVMKMKKAVFVTGATVGSGLACAERFAKEGSVLTYEVNTEDPEAIQTYYGLIDFTAGCGK